MRARPGGRAASPRTPSRGGDGRPSPSRLASVNSVRYEYWRVGPAPSSDDPLKGVGAGGFRVLWRRERACRDAVSEVHSLPLEMADGARGASGCSCSALFVGGVASRRGARSAHARAARARGVRRLRRLAAARVDRLGLAAPGGHAARRWCSPGGCSPPPRHPSRRRPSRPGARSPSARSGSERPPQRERHVARLLIQRIGRAQAPDHPTARLGRDADVHVQHPCVVALRILGGWAGPRSYAQRRPPGRGGASRRWSRPRAGCSAPARRQSSSRPREWPHRRARDASSVSEIARIDL